MRFAAALLFVALAGPLARADDARPALPAPTAAAKPARVSLRVVRVMPESHEALLFDRDHNKHVIAEIGTIIGDYQVTDIADDEVTLASHGNEIVLAAPERSHRRHDDADDTAAKPTKPVPAGPVDPYAPPAGAAPADPYADAPIRVVEAPVDPYADAPIRVVEAPDATPAAPVRVVEAPASPSAPAAPTPTPAPTVVTVPAALVSDDPALALTRPELTAALGDFTKLTAGIRASFGPTGVRVDSVVAGSLFARAGLRAGDVITAVDGQPLRTLDDAADLYARASSARNLTISVLRSGKPASLHVTIK